jgi:hypothetical protein
MLCVGGFIDGLLGRPEQAISLSYTKDLFAHTKDAQGQPVQKMDAQALFQLLQAQRQKGNDDARKLSELLRADWQASQLATPISMSPMATQQVPQQPVLTIASLDDDATSYSAQDFWQLASLGISPDKQPEYILPENYHVLQTLRVQQQAQQAAAQSQQALMQMTQNMMTMGANAVNGLTAGSPAGGALPSIPNPLMTGSPISPSLPNTAGLPSMGMPAISMPTMGQTPTLSGLPNMMNMPAISGS